jgi:hypothetical protein
MKNSILTFAFLSKLCRWRLRKFIDHTPYPFGIDMGDEFAQNAKNRG